MTVPNYAWGLVWLLLVAWASDRYGMRGPFVAVPLVFLIVGYAILLSVESLGVRYLACYCKLIPLSASISSRSDKDSDRDGCLSHYWNVDDVVE